MDIICFTENLVKGIVKNPDMVKVQLLDESNDVNELEIIVKDEDMGVVIGKNGKMASSIRTIIQAFAYLNNIKKVKINIDSF